MRQVGSYLNCPRCGLSIGIRSPWLTITHCPRCLARARALVEMFSSGLPSDALYANGSVPQPDISTRAACDQPSQDRGFQ